VRPFTPQDAGNPPERWRAQRFWRDAPLLGLPPRQTRIVVLAAHADDETLGVGGLIAAAGRRGYDVQIVIASDGAGSHPRSPTLSPARLVEARRGEAERAVAALAPGAGLVQLGFPDGGLDGVVDDIADALRNLLGADTDTWLLSTWLDDGHPDHAACARAARRVAAERQQTRELEYPVWFWHAGDPEHPGEMAGAARMFELDQLDRAARAQALRCYPSQTEPLSAAPGDEAMLPPQVLAHVDRPVDVLLDVVPRPAGKPGYFDALYAADEDPWRLRDSWYEQRKRAILLAALPRRRYRRCFEPGSARGDLSALLADRVDELVCAEASAAAKEARRRIGTRAEVLPLHVPGQWPEGGFDLIVLSEIGYYLDLAALSKRIEASLEADGTLVLVHWRHVAKDHPHTAETVHLTLARRLRMDRVVAHCEADFLLDVLVRAQADSSLTPAR
jgi:LmbE family N-acetylglucosaminyl deacetylase